MPTDTVNTEIYPRDIELDGRTITLKLMSKSDAKKVLAFANSLPEDDLIFLRWDITDKDGINHWVRSIQESRTVTVLAFEKDKVVGYGSLHHHQLFWTRHHGEFRIMVNESMRGLGLGRHLAGELFELAQELGLRRIVVNIASNQPRVRHMFEEMGFHASALLTDWLMDSNDKMSDLIIMSVELDA